MLTTFHIILCTEMLSNTCGTGKPNAYEKTTKLYEMKVTK